MTGPEAITHLERALEVLQTLPDTPARARNELEIRIALVTPTISIRGYGSHETAQTIAKARAIAEKVGDAAQLFPIMYGEWAFNIVSGKIETSRQLAEQYTRPRAARGGHCPAAHRSPDARNLPCEPRRILPCPRTIGAHLGALRFRVARILRLYLRANSRVSALTFSGAHAADRRFAQQAFATARSALEYADDMKHPNTQGVVLCLAGALLQEICRNPQE